LDWVKHGHRAGQDANLTPFIWEALRLNPPVAYLPQAALAAVGLTGFERRTIGTLSGGQMQRALFARLLLQDAAVILLDEPLTAIDTRTAADMMAIVRRWHDEARTVVAVLHDLDLVRTTFPQCLLIARSPIAWGATDAVLTPQNLLAARHMVEAHDPHADACQRAA
jgi:zinc/manganese transport system ATP-binding protein